MASPAAEGSDRRVVAPPLELLACPLCKSGLADAGGGFRCAGCGKHWPMEGGVVDFRPEEPGDPAWFERQRQMTDWYEALVGDREQAAHCLRTDYAGIADVLAGLSGTVLDLGGGAGVTRHYLEPSVRYVDLDPSIAWLDPDWARVAGSFGSGDPMYFARGVGERLPLRTGTFDAVLSLWSLNHATAVPEVLDECARVLRRGGLLLLLLEDMEPSWRDFLRAPLRREPAAMRRKLAHSLTGRDWPLQPDHVRVEEAELHAAASGRLTPAWRAWVGAGPPSYLALALRRS